MIRRGLLLAALVAASPAVAGAGELDALIESNQKSLERTIREFESYERQDMFLPPARLWVHTRTGAQERLVAEIEARAGAITLPSGPVDLMPVQRVDVGPSRSQLRVFKAVDRQRAHRIARAVREVIPDLEVKDFTAEYGKVVWVKPGHLELWLAPEIR